MTSILIEPKIVVPQNQIRETDGEGLGLSFWLSERGSQWICETLDAKPLTIRIQADREEEAYLPCFQRKIFPGVILVSGYPYTRIFGNAELFWNNIDSFIQTCRKHGMAKIELPFSGHDLEAFHQSKIDSHSSIRLSEQTEYTRQLIDISSLARADSIENAFHGKLRWSIHRALKEGAEYHPVTGESCKDVHDLYVQSMNEKNAPAYYGNSRFRYIIDHLSAGREGVVYQAQLGGTIVGMAAVLYSQTTAHLIQVAVLRKYASSRIGDFLVGAAQWNAARCGKTTFDFMATPAFEPGVKEYKTKWGGRTESVRTLTVIISKPKAMGIDVLRHFSRLFPKLLQRKS